MCKYCFSNDIKPEDRIFTDFERDNFINGVFIGAVTVKELPTNIYAKTAEHLEKGVLEGYRQGSLNIDWMATDEALIADLTENIYVFSGAKTYQQVRTMSNLLKDDELRNNFYKFKEAALVHFDEYNGNYLAAEYHTAIASSKAAAEWTRIEQDKDILPMLTYQTVGDARVRPTHAALDNISRPVDDKFWDEFYPPNGWNCRCIVEQNTDDVQKTNLQGWLKPDDVPPLFRMNSGKDRIIFSKKHPYFRVAKGDKAAAKRNFDLPIPKKK